MEEIAMNVEQLRKQAKELVRAVRAGDPEALDRLGGRSPILANAQLVLAREHGYPSWPALVGAAESQLDGQASRSPREAVEHRIARGLFFPVPTPFTVDLDTVRFLKERQVLGRHLFAVSFETTSHVLSGARHEMGLMIVAVPHEGVGWRAERACGIPSGTRASSTKPRVELGAQWNLSDGFYGAARIYRADAHVTSVRLRFPDGTAAAADPEDDLALFFVAQPHADRSPAAPHMPQTIELLDGEDVIATQPARQLPQRPPPATPPSPPAP
jgi:hypothetical protein